MSDSGNIIGTWEDAENSKKRDNFASAARLFRMYNIYYKNGDNTVEKGDKSYDKYRKLLRKLPKDENAIIEASTQNGWGYKYKTFVFE